MSDTTPEPPVKLTGTAGHLQRIHDELDLIAMNSGKRRELFTLIDAIAVGREGVSKTETTDTPTAEAEELTRQVMNEVVNGWDSIPHKKLDSNITTLHAAALTAEREQESRISEGVVRFLIEVLGKDHPSIPALLKAADAIAARRKQSCPTT